MSDPGRANIAAAVALVDEFARANVREVCVSPGSRSAPLAIALACESRIRKWVITDERSAGFFALGAARESEGPVLLVCTSGTAAAHYAPAIIEAFQGSVPLIVVTADRPTELRDWGAPQTIVQPGLFAHHVLWEAELPTPLESPDLAACYRTTACRAVAVATGSPRGPVHINLPLREPLFDDDGLEELARETRARGRKRGVPWVRVHPPHLRPNPQAIRGLVALADRVERGAIVCGPGSGNGKAVHAIVSFARRIGWPVLADPLSGLRHGPHDKSCVADAHDIILRSDELRTTLLPEAVLRVGGVPSSKPLQRLLDSESIVHHIAVAADERWRDPFFRVNEIVRGDVAEVFREATESAAERGSSQWLADWMRASRAARTSTEQTMDALDEPFEGRIAHDVLAAAPAGTLVVVGNSTPVRDVDTFFATSEGLELVGNRGANGIDGLLSTALGAAAVGRRPILLLVGDLTFLHDSGALHLARQYDLSATVVVVNNDGGQIFARLPQGALKEKFLSLFTTPHGTRLADFPSGCGVHFHEVNEPGALAATVASTLQTSGLDVAEVMVSAERSPILHRDCVAAAVRGAETILRETVA